MRLINIETRKLELYTDTRSTPPYVCLSHRWTDDEILYEEYEDGTKRNTTGWKKINQFCDFIERHQEIWANRHYYTSPVRHCWVDTVCIDKRSSSELSEAINSMWNIYRNAYGCIAYLTGVIRDSEDWLNWFIENEWFKRCWTLQELLAPALVIFCGEDWAILGTTSDKTFLTHVSKASKIQVPCLIGSDVVEHQSIARRMSWAAGREATRIEDVAYSLLGLFDINMPLLYGEGAKAFKRLQMEIIRQSDDESIFTWRRRSTGILIRTPILADSPNDFSECTNNKPTNLTERPSYTITKYGLELKATTPYRIDPWNQTLDNWPDEITVIQLNCSEPITSSMASLEPRFGPYTKQGCLMFLDASGSRGASGKPVVFYRVLLSAKEEAKVVENLIRIKSSGHSLYPWPTTFILSLDGNDASPILFPRHSAHREILTIESVLPSDEDVRSLTKIRDMEKSKKKTAADRDGGWLSQLQQSSVISFIGDRILGKQNAQGVDKARVDN